MADLLATIVAAIGTAYTVSKNVNTFVRRVRGAPREIQEMGEKIDTVRTVLEALHRKLEHDFKDIPPYPESYQKDMIRILVNVNDAFKRAEGIVGNLEMPEEPTAWHRLKATVKLKWDGDDITRCNESITFYFGLVQIFLGLTSA